MISENVRVHESEVHIGPRVLFEPRRQREPIAPRSPLNTSPLRAPWVSVRERYRWRCAW